MDSPARAVRTPGTGLSCTLLTAITVASVSFPGYPEVLLALRPLYFAVLYSFFRRVRARPVHNGSQPLRLVELGFLIMTVAFAASAGVQMLDSSGDSPLVMGVVASLEQGAGFLLGLTLISFGVLLSVAELVDARTQLQAHFRRTRGKLRLSESARARMEQRMVEADRLHTLGQLAAGIAHDMRNPLAIVRAAAGALSQKARSPEDVAEHCRVIVRNVDKAERTVQALLEVGKPRRQQASRFTIDALLADVMGLVAVEAKRRCVAIDTDAASVAMLSDSRLLVQALLNLVLNALQATPDGGRIRLRARRVNRPPGGPRIAIAVEDRGNGLRGIDRSRLFSPFFTTKPGGTGLGLLSTRRIMAEMGGDVRLYPRRRGGARALALLPEIAPGEAPAPAAAAEGATAAGAETAATAPTMEASTP
jgi:signal transduction histidine kinase